MNMNAFKKILVTIAAAATLGGYGYGSYGGYGYNNYPSYGYGYGYSWSLVRLRLRLRPPQLQLRLPLLVTADFPASPRPGAIFKRRVVVVRHDFRAAGGDPSRSAFERASDEKHLGFVDAAELTPGGVGLPGAR